MGDKAVIQQEPPWVVEIEGVKFATPELVCLLLQDVSEERDQLEAELLKFRRLDITWGEEVKELDLTIANLKEELGHLHSRFDRVLDDTFKEGG